MKAIPRQLALAFAIALLGTPAIRAQQEPHIGYVYPAGGKHGTTIQVTVGGQFLDGVDQTLVSGDGVTVTVLDHTKPLTQKQVNDLRQKLQEVRKKIQEERGGRFLRIGPGNLAAFAKIAEDYGISAEELKALDDYRKRLTDPKRQLNPQIAETVTLEMTLAPDAPLGRRELRLLTDRGMSNPMSFFVGNLAECSEQEPNDQTPDAGVGDRLPIVVNGQIFPGDVDRFEFQARRGQNVVVSVAARRLIPYLADAVPGWFQATAAVFDAAGNEVEPNNQAVDAQPVTGPSVINGRVDVPGDWDVFRLEARAGEELVAEVSARRLNSSLDSVLELTDADGHRVAVNDDHEDRGAALTTHHADSLLSATFPSDGIYYLRLGDTQGRGGETYGYRLRISPPRPDFELRITPASINVRAGATVPVDVYALRRDGFSGPVSLRLEDMPWGFLLSGGTIPTGQDHARVTVTAPPRAGLQPIRLTLQGTAEIAGRPVQRTAVPAEDMMQAFAYRHLVPAEEGLVAVVGPGRAARGRRCAWWETCRSSCPWEVPLVFSLRFRQAHC